MSFKRLVAAGVKEVFGSGAYTNGHGVQAFQFAYYVKWGMTPAQALQMATSSAAESLNFQLGETGWERGSRQVRRPGGRLRRSAGRHHRNAAREIRYERRSSISEMRSNNITGEVIRPARPLLVPLTRCQRIAQPYHGQAQLLYERGRQPAASRRSARKDQAAHHRYLRRHGLRHPISHPAASRSILRASILPKRSRLLPRPM